MKHLSKIRMIAVIMLVLLAGLAIRMKSLASVSGLQTEQSYILTAGQWSDEQSAEVSEAGGVVTFSHRHSGIGVVSSSAPDFLDRALASGKFTGGAADQVVQWQMPTDTMEFGESGVTPGDETFNNLQWNNLQQLGAAANSFRNQNGASPDDLADLAAFCAANPDRCSLDAELASGQKGGYFYFVSNATLGAEPIHPGITGADTVLMDQDGNLRVFATPGAEEARQRMLNNIRDAGAEKLAELLEMDRSSLRSVRDFIRLPENTALAFDRLERGDGTRSGNGNDFVSVDEILNFRTGTDIPLESFLESVSRDMRLDLLSTEERRAIGVSLSGVEGNPGEIFDFDGLCSLTQMYVSEQGVANQLCAKLIAARSTAEHGRAEDSDRFLADYINDVDAQIHRTVTKRKGITLITITKTLSVSSPGIFSH